MNTSTIEKKLDYLNKVSAATGPCLSISLECEGGGKNHQHHRDRLRIELNRIRKEAGDDETVQDLVSKAESLLSEGKAWSGDYSGICIHIFDNETRVIKTAYPPIEKVQIGDSPLLRPAADAISAMSELLVLNISLKSPRVFVFQGSEAELLGDLELPDSVYSFSEEGALDAGKRAHIRRARGSDSPQMATQGVSAAKSPRELNEPVFMREVARVLGELPESKDLPLVVIGDTKVVSKFLESYRHAGGEVVTIDDSESNPSESDVGKLCREIAWKRQQETKTDTLEKISEAQGSGELFSTNVSEIYEASVQGRVASVVLACDDEVWFRMGEDGRPHSAEEGEEGAFEALDRIYLETTLKDGEAIVLPSEDIPGEKGIAAVFRW